MGRGLHLATPCTIKCQPYIDQHVLLILHYIYCAQPDQHLGHLQLPLLMQFKKTGRTLLLPQGYT